MNLQQLTDAFPLSNAGRVVRRTFECLAIAEEEIARALRSRSNSSEVRRARIRRAFLALQPPDQLIAKADVVYRYHCAELLQRAAEGRDLRPGTEAEVLCAMRDARLLARRSPQGYRRPRVRTFGCSCSRCRVWFSAFQ